MVRRIMSVSTKGSTPAKIVDILTNFSNSLGATHTTTDEVDRQEQANYQKMVGRLG